MNINDVFPSNYLKASDLNGRKVKVTIESVELEKLGDEQKPVLRFSGKEKGLVLNKTKAGILGSAFSPETDGWIGKTVFLYPTQVNFQGQMVAAIGLEPEMVVADEFNDAIPFAWAVVLPAIAALSAMAYNGLPVV